MIQKIKPGIMAQDVCAVQPMANPTGLIFGMRSIFTIVKAEQQTEINRKIYDYIVWVDKGTIPAFTAWCANQLSDEFHTAYAGKYFFTAEQMVLITLVWPVR